jgi:hypothetical protein
MENEGGRKNGFRLLGTGDDDVRAVGMIRAREMVRHAGYTGQSPKDVNGGAAESVKALRPMKPEAFGLLRFFLYDAGEGGRESGDGPFFVAERLRRSGGARVKSESSLGSPVRTAPSRNGAAAPLRKTKQLSARHCGLPFKVRRTMLNTED